MDIPNGAELAGIGSRFVSYLVDSIILAVIGVGLAFVILTIGARYMPAMYAPILCNLAYFIYFFGSGQTPGMKVMNIKLIRTRRSWDWILEGIPSMDRNADIRTGNRSWIPVDPDR